MSFLKLLIAALFLLSLSREATGQSNGDYRTIGNVTFNSPSNWQKYNFGWAAAATPPTFADEVITIRAGHTATLTAPASLNQLVVNVGGILTINAGQTMTLVDGPGTDLNVSGTLNNSGDITINAGAIINFDGGSVYNHAKDGGSIPSATWNPTSNCNITGIIGSTLLGGLGQTFGNFTWNCPGQTDNLYLETSFTVAGNFTISGTGAYDPTSRALRMSNTSSGYTITVNGDFLINNDASFKMNNGNGSCTLIVNGNFTMDNSSYFCIVTGDASSTLTVNDNVNILGGYLSMQEEASQTAYLNVGRNFTLAGTGQIDETATGAGKIIFNGGTTQIFSRSGGTITNTINFEVNSGSVLDLGTSVIDGSDGTFILNAGAGIVTAHTQGLSTTAGTGSIQVTGLKTFSSSADYTYNGASAQVTGNALPASVHNLTINNPNGISLTNGVTVGNILTMQSGNISCGANTLILSNSAAASLVYSTGTIIGRFERYINNPLGVNYLFPVGSATQIHSLTAVFNNLAAGSLLVQYISGDPGNSGLPLNDADGSQVTDRFTTGYWSALAKNSLSSSNYNINADATGFGPYSINGGTRLLKRSDSGGSWVLDGVHSAAAGSVIKRTALSGILNSGGGTQFGGGNCVPRITSQPGDQTVCVGNNAGFSVTASGSGTLTYQWYKAPATVLTNDGHFGGTTTSNLTITSVSTGDAGNYYCIVSDQYSNTTQSNNALLTVNANPAITAQPVSPAAVCEGTGTQIMSVTATGYNLTYQWQENTGSTWNNITNSGIYSGATTSSLTLTNPAKTMDGYQYRVIVTGGCAAPVTSNAVSITVRANPVITAQPVAPAAVCEGTGTQVMSVTATGYTVNYQWQENTGSTWNNITNSGIYSGATTSSLTLTNPAKTMDGYQYRVIVTGGCAAPVTSNAVSITVRANPVITAQPVAPAAVCEGTGTQVMSVTATGYTVNYQWQENTGSTWNNITNSGIYSGATTSSLTLTSPILAMNGYQYRVIVTGGCGSPVTSSAVSITVRANPVITAQPIAPAAVCEGTGTQVMSVTATGYTVTYQWQENTGSGWNNITNSGIYSGATSSSLTLTSPTLAMDGYQYRVIVTGGCGTPQTSNAVGIIVRANPVITVQPVAPASVCEGTGTQVMTVTATGYTVNYQWQENQGSGWNNVSNGGVYSGVTSNSLTLIGPTLSMNGYQYRLIVTGGCGAPVTSNAVSIIVRANPVITAQPVAPAAVCEGTGTQVMSVTATGYNVTYQWQENTGSTWNNITNSGIYSGATTSSLTLTNPAKTMDGYQYRVIVTGGCAAPVTSNAVSITVRANPVITAQPVAPAAVCEGTGTQVMSVTATGYTVNYQWQENTGSTWNNITNSGIYSGATTSSLTLTSPILAMNGYQYRVIVTGGCGSPVTSSAVSITVRANPVITAQPVAPAAVCEGTGTQIMSVTATGYNLTYQWQENTGSTWNNITNSGIYSGATTSSLTLTSPILAMNGYQYRVIVTGGCGSPVTSSAVSITVRANPVITAQPIAPAAVCEGTGTQVMSVTATGYTVTYQWQENTGSGWNNITNSGIYSGATSSSLTLTSPTLAMDGYQYRVIVTGGCGTPQTSNAVGIIVRANPVITVQPVAPASVCEGTGTQVMTVTATGYTVNYQWQENQGSGWNNVSNGGVYSGVTSNSLTLIGPTLSMNGYQYRLIVTGGCGAPVTSNAVSIIVRANPVITAQPVAPAAVCEGTGTQVMSVTATGYNVTYQWQENTGSTWNNITNSGIYSGATTSSLTLTNPAKTMDGYQYRVIVTGGCAAPVTSNAVSITVRANPVITAQPVAPAAVCEGTGTQVMSVTATGYTVNYQWQENTGSTWNNITNSGIYSGATTSSLTLTSPILAMNGYQYRVIVTGGCGSPVTSSAVSITVRANPVITAQPVAPAAVCEGTGTQIMSVTATGYNLTYQWQENTGSTWNNITNSGIYSGATTSSLTLTSPTLTMDGYQYRVIVTGGCGSPQTSSAVSITVRANPVITAQPIAPAAVCEGTGTQVMSVTATGYTVTYQWQENTGSGWNNITNSGIYSGATSSSLTLTSPTLAMDGYQYRVIVTGGCGTPQTSNAVGIIVRANPVITVQPVAPASVCEGTGTQVMTVTATGYTVNYQWQENQGSGWNNVSNGGVYSGVTSNSLTLIGPTLSMNGYQYRLIVTGGCGAPVTSNAVSIIVRANPVITAQPVAPAAVCEGTGTQVMSVTATGYNVTYQWQENTGSTWNNITNSGIYSGATTSSLTLTNPAKTMDGYQYRVIVTGGCAAPVTSNAVSITVRANPVITAQPVAPAAVCEGTGTQVMSVTATGYTVNYQWQENTGSTWNNITNSGIYSGATTSSLTLTSPILAMNGYQYRVIVTGGCGSPVTSSAVSITVRANPVITAQPVAPAAVCEGTGTQIMSVTATGYNLTYQWQENTGSTWNNITNSGIYSGATTSSLTLTSPTLTMDGYQYRVIVTGGCGSPQTSSAVSITVRANPVITAQPITPAAVCEGTGTQVMSVTATGYTVTYQWQENQGSGWNNITNSGIYSGATSSSLTLTSPTLAMDGYQYRVIVTGGCGTPQTSNAVGIIVRANPVITVQPVDPSPICEGVNVEVISVTATGYSLSYQWQEDQGSGWNNLTNGGVYSGVTTSSLTLTNLTLAMNGYRYRVIVSGGCSLPVTSNSVTASLETIVPTITCSGAIAKNVDAGACNASVVIPDAVIADNCSVASLTWTITGVTNGNSPATGINQIGTHIFNTGLTNILYVVKDRSGNQSTCSFTVTVTDNIDPTITCPGNIITTTSADGTGNCTTTATLGLPVTADNCSVAGVIAQVGGVTINPGTYAFPIGITIVTWIVTDVNGRTANCAQTVTVTDNEDPTITCQSNIVTSTSADGTGNCTTKAVLGIPVTSDNCSVAGVIAQVGGATINPATYDFPTGTTTVTWIVTDGSGRTASCTQTVSVSDDENPTIICPGNIVTTTSADGTGNCTTTVATGAPSTSDNCGILSLVGTRNDFLLLTDPYPVGITTIHWVVTDVNGNKSSCDQTVTVTDNENPSLVCPADISHTADPGLCSYSVAISSPVTGDNCSVLSTVGSRSDLQLLTAPYPVGLTTIHWVVTDINGNSTSCDQKITVTDNEAPILNCPANVILNCQDDNTPSGTGVATATDNCTPVASISITHSDVSPYNSDPSTALHYNYFIARTWKAVDLAGNFSECTQTITVHDITNPSISCPPDVTINCEENNTPAGTGTATATDNCSPAANIAITYSDLSTYVADPANVLHYNYVIARKWKATDIAGNFSECIQTITVHDIYSPVITCPANVTINCEADQTPTGTGTPVVTDSCTPLANITVGFTDVSTYDADPSVLLHYNYVISRTWKATDVAGNYSECIQTITVHDVTKPVITCPSGITLNCEDNSSPSGAGGTPTVTDNCAPLTNIIVGYTDVSTYDPDPSGLLHYNYSITRTWRATDVAGNYNECIQSIIVHDITKPVINCPTNVTLNCEDDNTPAGTGTATATDICTPIPNIAITHSDASTYSINPADVSHYNYVITRIWRATDVAGNYNECTQLITVHDVTNPDITCPANAIINCEDNNTPSGTGTATASDICTPVSNIAISHTDVSTYSADPANVFHYNYVITRNWKATDVAGNFSVCVQTITVHDISNPVIACPANVTISCDADNTPAGTGSPVISDNCSPLANITVGFTDVSTYNSDPSTSLHYNYVISRTWKATDVAGNFSECIQTITVHDITDPVISCPANLTVSCDADNSPSATGSATATDICTPLANIVIIHSDASTYSSDPLNLLHYNYVITRTWRATDVTGNFSECNQIITVHDITNPVISCPVNVTINCDSDNSPAGTGVATATDNCTPQADLTITHSDASTYNPDPATVLHYNYIIIRTWRARDIAGNTGSCTQTIAVHDITKPVISCPANVTVNCDADLTPSGTGSATATDNCSPLANIVITYSDVSTYSSDPANSLHYNYVITRTWRATDRIGNFNECNQIITVHDIINPLISCPADITLSCEDDTSPATTGTATATDNCSPVANIVITHSDLSTYSSDPATILHYNYTITRTWRATDVRGNFSECIQTITVHDITKPTFTVPSTITICRAADCTYSALSSVTGDVTDEADNCTPANLLNATFTDDISGASDCNNVGVILRSWSLTDIAGNTTVKIQTIRVEPTPSVSIINNSPIICDGANVNLVINSVTNSINSADLSYVVTVSSSDPANLSGTASTGFTKLKADLPFSITGTLTNSSDAPIIVTFTVSPKLNGCSDGPVQTTTVTVNPTPQVVPDKLAQAICNDAVTNITLGSPSTFTSGLITFDYTVVATGGVTGFTSPTTGLPKNHVIADILHNPTDAPQTVTYTIVPKSPTGCPDGPVKTVIVTVNPTPQVIPGTLTQTICNDGTTNISLGSPSTFASGVITFKYTVVATGGVTGFTTPVSGLPKDHIIADLLHNPSDAPQTVTYSVVPVSPGSCPDGPVKTIVVTVNPTPQVIPSSLTQAICNDGTTNIILGSPSTFTSGLITFNLTATATGGVTGFTSSAAGLPKDHVIADVLNNPTDSPQTVTYVIVPVSPTGCASGPVKTIVVTVNPTPQVVPSALVQKICNDGTTSIVLNSPSTFSTGAITFNYTVIATGGVTGFTTPVTGLPYDYVISDILHNPTNDPQTVTYTIVPVSPGGCASGPAKVVVITVEPTPQVVPSTLSQIICNNTSTTILLTSPSTFSNGVITFNYTVTATGGVTGFTTPVTGLPNNTTISDILHNPTDVPQTVTYTIVPISPECSASDPIKIVTVTVNPTPQVDPLPLNQTICNDGTTNVTLGSPSTFTSGLITFNLTAVATGGVTGFTISASGLAKDHVIADVLHNPTDSPQTVTYTISPFSPTGCTDGPSKTVVVTVNPTPQVVPGTLSQTICNEAALNIPLASPSTFNNGAITFNYTVIATGGVTGFTTPVTGLAKDHVISDILHNPTDQPQTVTYTIVPVSPSGCASGPVKVIVITVNPTPQVVPSTLAQTICNDGTTNVILTSPSIFTSGLITFNYTVVATGGVTGFTTPATGLAKDHIISDLLHNPTDSPQTVTYTIVPISPSGCSAGPSKTVVITVNPTPQVNPGTLAQTICNDAVTNVVLASPSTFTSGLITFRYTVTATGGVTGFTTPTTGLARDHVISDVLHNPTDIPQTVTYTIVPVSPNGCADGPSKVVIITVNPTPQVVPSTLAQTICNDGATNIVLGSPSVFTSGLITFNYTVTATGGVTGFITPVTGLPLNSRIQDVLHNPTDSPQTVTYTIVPVSPSGCTAGPSKVVVVTVNPTPQVFPVTLTPTLCNDGITNIRLTSPSTFTTGGITFNYTVVATGGVTGFTTPVNGLALNFVIADILHNPTDAPQTVTYTIIPVSPTGCASGPAKVVVITVNPTPQLYPSTLTQILCNDGTTSVTLGSPSTFSNGSISFRYTVVATGGVSGFTSPVAGLPKDHVLSDVLHNPADSPQTVTYTIVPVSPAGCAPGPAKIVVITVNPTPRIYPVPSNWTQCDSLTTNILLQSPSIFSSGLISFKYSVTTTGSVTGYSTPIGGISNNYLIGDKLINNTDHYQSVTYTVVPVSPLGCTDGVSRDIQVIVNPTPRAVLTNNFPAICYVGTPKAPVSTGIVLNSPTVMTSGGITFDYTVSVTGGPGVIVGNTSPASDVVPGYTINYAYQNNSSTLQSVYYSVVPINHGLCLPGKKVISEVKVHPQPLQSMVVTKPLTCSGGAGLAALMAVISQGADPYQVVWDGPVGYHKTDSLKIANLSSGKYVVKVTDNLGCNRKDSVSIVPVTARAYISADVIPPGNYNISCIGATDGQILVSVTGGITPPYNYTILKNDVQVLYTGVFTGNLNLTDPTTYRYYNNLGAGSYTLVIRDINGCENVNRIVFRVPPPIVTVINKSSYAGGFNVSCKGYNDGSAWVQSISGGRGGYSYRWYTTDGLITGPINTNRIDNLIAGTYFLEIKDVLNCIQTETVVITEPDGMQLAGYLLSKSPDNNFNISCKGGNDGSISLTVTGGSGNYLFTWTGTNGYSASTKDITGLKAGSYTCSVKDLNGCVLTPSPSLTLTEPTQLVINTPVKSVSTDGAYNINCFGANTGSVSINVTGGSVGNYRYDWSTADGSGIIAGQKDQTTLAAGTYHLIVTDLNNCVATTDVTLTQAPVFIAKLSVTNITCKSPGFNNGSIALTVTGGIPPYTYSWSNGSVTQNLTGLTPGDYEVAVTDFNGCVVRASSTVQLPPDLSYTKSLSDYNGFNISCNGLADGYIHINLVTGAPPYVYTWTGPSGFSSQSKDISDLKAGQYEFMVVDTNECKASEIFNMTEPGKLGMTFNLSESNAGGYNINCAGDSTGSIDVLPVNQVKTVDYLWADGIFGQNRTNLPAGNYNVIITDANNCHASSVIILTEPDSLKLVFDVSPPFCPDKPDGVITANVSGGVRGTDYYYVWNDNSTNRNLSDIPKGFYKVVVKDLNGCIIKDSINVDPLNETCLVIPKAISPNGDLINDVWNIGMKELYPMIEVKIFNRWGELIWRSEKGYPRPWDGRSNGTLLPIDSYHYLIDLHNGSKPVIGNVTIVR